MKNIKTFEGFFSDLFKKKDNSEVTPELLSKRQSDEKSLLNSKLKEEAEKKFPTLVKEFDSKLRETKNNFVESSITPTFTTKSTRKGVGTDLINKYLMDIVIDHYTKKGFKVDMSRSLGGSDHNWFRIYIK